MDFKQLETFVAVVKLKSFSKAAENLFITQPTVSNHILNLEKELNTILINRTNKNITLTTAGTLLYKYAIDILNKRDNAVFSLNQFKGKIEGILEISSSTIPEQYYLPLLLKKFSALYPDVKYDLKKYDTSQVIDKILSGEIDFGIVGAKKDCCQLVYIEIMNDNIIFVSQNKGKFSNIDSITINELSKFPIIMREKGSGTRNVVENSLKKHNLSTDDLNVIATIENTETIKECVKQGLGFTFISDKAITYDIENKFIKNINIDGLEFKRKFYFVYHKSRALSPLAETFKKFVLKFKKNQANPTI
ncbi:DNA-binding transcriptional regulator, LysR family [Maledivibacter halophilus]|uniref:DNA-binding transcriptional regulator, LysR family n=2 Tax=Maledivibacter halophilus TaxID=36842 RepID=A0A1T5KLC6_9FIRM|nr:DNA-binding transcriptional regulator, LysR family [Maledivibacter halophilus]